jgi:hypothetical protein
MNRLSIEFSSKAFVPDEDALAFKEVRGALAPEEVEAPDLKSGERRLQARGTTINHKFSSLESIRALARLVPSGRFPPDLRRRVIHVRHFLF